MERLEGRVAVVTGAASGIGRALALRLAEEGMAVAVSDVEAEPLEETAGALRRAGGRVLARATDVSDPEAVEELAERTLAELGAPHVLCNNAGVFAGGLCWEMPLADYGWVLSVNLWGVVHGLRSFVPRMLASGEPGHVLNTASMAALTSAPLSAAYVMSKHAVLALSESLYHELRMKHAPIGVSVICPEMIATGIGEAGRNRPPQGRRDEASLPADTRLVEEAIRAAVRGGADPGVIAERAVQAIREQRFYVLAPPGDPWRNACEWRLEDLRAERNPSCAGPAAEPPAG